MHRAGHVLDGNLGIDPVQVEEVDVVGAEKAQTVIGDLPDMVGPAVETGHAGLAVEHEPNLVATTISSR